MNYLKTPTQALLTACIALLACLAAAQDSSNLPYMNPKLTAQERAAELVHRMPLEEIASQLVNQARAIPRRKVPAYGWWSEALHGAVPGGTTECTAPAGPAATFNPPR